MAPFSFVSIVYILQRQEHMMFSPSPGVEGSATPRLLSRPGAR